MWVIGPKCSGKSVIAKNVAQRTNADHIEFLDFLKEEGLEEADDERVCLRLNQVLAQQKKPRVIIENFPRSEFQAKFFVRNVKRPSNVFLVECSKETCQERMIQNGESDPNYIPSALLSHLIKEYHQSAQ
jgi:adenylate kinase family enzyme